MYHFHGSILQNWGIAGVMRSGTRKSGLITICASNEGAIQCYAYYDDKSGKDMVWVEMVKRQGRGENRVLYHGPIGEYVQPQPAAEDAAWDAEVAAVIRAAAAEGRPTGELIAAGRQLKAWIEEYDDTPPGHRWPKVIIDRFAAAAKAAEEASPRARWWDSGCMCELPPADGEEAVDGNGCPVCPRCGYKLGGAPTVQPAAEEAPEGGEAMVTLDRFKDRLVK